MGAGKGQSRRTRTATARRATKPSHGPLVKRLERAARTLAQPGTEAGGLKHYDDLIAVGNILAEAGRAMHTRWLTRPVTEEHNYFITRLAPSLASASKDSRKFTSRLGTSLESSVRKLIKERYGVESLPETVYSPLMSEAERARVRGQDPRTETEVERERSVIWTTANRDEVRDQAKTLVMKARNEHKLGTSEFAKMFSAAQKKVRAAERQEPWSLLVDAAVLDPGIGIVEMKSGGHLDSTKAEIETERLIAAGLAYNDPDLPIHFALLYPNRGEGNTPSGDLPTYFAPKAEKSGLLVGEQWWKRVLPESVSLEEMLTLFDEVGKTYEFSSARR